MLPKPHFPCSSCVYNTVTHTLKHKPYFNTITGYGFCNAEGSSRAGVAFVGDGSDMHEEEIGLPFRANAQAGSIHTRVIRSLYRSRKDTFATNVVACRPPNSEDPRPEAINACRPLLQQRLAKWHREALGMPGVKTPIVVALGDVAWTELTGKTGDSINKRSIQYARGYPEMSPYGFMVMGTFHPADVRKNTKLMGVLVEDYRTAFDVAENGWNPLPQKHIRDATDWQIRDFRDMILGMDPNDPNFWLIFDYETPDVVPEQMPDRIISVQYSIAPGHAIFMYINRDTLPVVRQIMMHPCRKAGHNTLDFDVPLSFHHDIPIAGIVDDSLLMWKHLQPDLVIEEQGAEAGSDWRYSTAAGLQYVASFFGADALWKYKRLSQNVVVQEEYANEDVDNNARIIYGAPHRRREGLVKQMRDRGIWNGYDRYVRQFYPVLQKAAKRGMPIDRQGQVQFAKDLSLVQAEIDHRIQDLHPDELKRVEPKEGYKTEPKASDKIRWTWRPAATATVKSQIGKGPEWDFSDPAQPWLRYVGDPAYGIWEWLDQGEEVAAEFTVSELGEEQPPVVTDVWRPMVRRVFHGQEVKTKVNCSCLHAPDKGRGRKAFNGMVPNTACAQCGGKGIFTVTSTESVERWARLIPFAPSNKQLTTYAQAKGHRLPKVKGKVTTAAKGIEELVKTTGDPLYQSVLDVRTIDKMKSTYVVGKGWMKRKWEKKVVVKNGFERVKWVETTLLPIDQQPPRVHTTFTLGPATAQTSSRRPNVQNAPKHTRNKNLKALNVPKRFRALIKARPGYRIWEFDLKSAHAYTLGLEAKSGRYMRLAKLDMHTYFTAAMMAKQGLWPAKINLSQPDADLKAALKECRAHVTPSGLRFEQDVRDVRAKPAILGIGFGMMGRKLWDTNKESFKDEFDAQEVINDYYAEFPEILAYHNAVIAEAHDKKHLISRGGFIRWFWQVHDFRYNPYDWDAKPTTSSHGDDAEDAKAFRPANTAFVYMRDAEMRLEDLGVNEEANFINVVHDSNMFEILQDPNIALTLRMGGASLVLPAGHRSEEELARIIKTEMERPQPLLGDPELCPEGLTIGCDIKCGPDWAHMEDFKL